MEVVPVQVSRPTIGKVVESEPMVPKNARLLAEEAEKYIESKFGRRAFVLWSGCDRLDFAIQGIKAAMWSRVVKPELKRIASKYHYYIDMRVEKPEEGWIEFGFKLQKPVEPLTVERIRPLRDMELKQIRQIITGWQK